MKVYGVGELAVLRIVSIVSNQRYSGNIAVRRSSDESNSRGSRCTFTLRALDSRGPGARLSASGRRMPMACWHAYRDVLACLFAMFPQARVVTVLATYVGAQGFYATHPGTGRQKAGSLARPVCVAGLCACQHATAEAFDAFRVTLCQR